MIKNAHSKRWFLNVVCRHCGCRGEVEASAFERASPPRCMNCGSLVDVTGEGYQQKKGGAGKQKKKGKRKRRIGDPACLPMKPICQRTEAILDDVRKEAMMLGIDVETSYPVSYGRPTLFVMFNYESHRVVDFWPATGRVRRFDLPGQDELGKDIWEALQSARIGVQRLPCCGHLL